MLDILPGYKQEMRTKCTGPGLYKASSSWKIVLHTTESPPGSGQAVIDNIFTPGDQCKNPHFVIDPQTKERFQLLPLSYSGSALVHGQGGFETNKARAIQVEIVGYSDLSKPNPTRDWDDPECEFIGQFIADVMNGGYPINLNHVTKSDYKGTVAIENSQYRMSGIQFEEFDGVCGHIDVPFQNHYDPYLLNKQRCAEFALKHLGFQEDDVTEDDMKKIAGWAADEVMKRFGTEPGNPIIDKARNKIADSVNYMVTGTAKAQGQAFAKDVPEPSLGTIKAELDEIKKLVTKSNG